MNKISNKKGVDSYLNHAELKQQLDEIRALRTKRKLSSSRMNKHLEQIFHLRFVENASCADISLWLRRHKRMKVTRQAVHKFISKHLDSRT